MVLAIGLAFAGLVLSAFIRLASRLELERAILSSLSACIKMLKGDNGDGRRRRRSSSKRRGGDGSRKHRRNRRVVDHGDDEEDEEEQMDSMLNAVEEYDDVDVADDVEQPTRVALD